MIIPPLRDDDSWGSGAYGASRGGRSHKGVDFSIHSGVPVFSDVPGVVKRTGYPYDPSGDKGEYRLIEIQVDTQTKIKYMYLEPHADIKPGARVERGDCIGYAQDLTKIYPGITNHVHFEVWVEGSHVDPVQWLKLRGWA